MWTYALRILCVSLLSTRKGQGDTLFAFLQTFVACFLHLEVLCSLRDLAAGLHAN